MNINKNDLIHGLKQMFNIDDVKNYVLNDDYMLWGQKETDDDGQFIWGEIITKNNDGDWSEVMFGFAYDKSDILDDLADYILNDMNKIEKEIKDNENQGGIK
jgi:hypothetical protein